MEKKIDNSCDWGVSEIRRFADYSELSRQGLGFDSILTSPSQVVPSSISPTKQVELISIVFCSRNYSQASLPIERSIFIGAVVIRKFNINIVWVYYIFIILSVCCDLNAKLCQFLSLNELEPIWACTSRILATSIWRAYMILHKLGFNNWPEPSWTFIYCAEVNQTRVQVWAHNYQKQAELDPSRFRLGSSMHPAVTADITKSWCPLVS